VILVDTADRDPADKQPYQVEASSCWLREEDVEFTGQRKDLMEGIQAREITKLANSDEFQEKVEEAAREGRGLVVAFFASWCRACKATKPKFMKIAKSWPEVEFCEILFDDNKVLAKEKGIKALPFFELYTGDKERVDGFQCGPSKIQTLDDALKHRTGGLDAR
jgi:thiol-disulfide isomerase/thioredoxin